MTNPYRSLPSVNDLRDDPALRPAVARFGAAAVGDAVRHALDEIRQQIRAGRAGDGFAAPARVVERVLAGLAATFRPHLRRVINATGIVLHTNLGRAPLCEDAARAAYDAARGYLNLELDLRTGKRSSRQDAVRELMCRLTGAEAATAVNNCAAATVIVLRAVCAGKEAIVSRGQLIEIGGSFRIPDIMAVSGTILREVGTTNITRLSDYERAIGPLTGALLRIHTSNYRVSGFTKSVGIEDLVALGRRANVPVIDDVGSGAMLDFGRFGFAGEPVGRDSITAGADLILFSGDKLLGGPQAGIIAGRKTWVERVEKDPLMRAFRLDKMTLAALEATARIYLSEERALREIPILSMLGAPAEQLRGRAAGIAGRLTDGLAAAAAVTVREDVAYVGGGSIPDQPMPAWVVSVQPSAASAEALARRLRLGDPAVLGRVNDGCLLLDPRTVFAEQEDDLVSALTAAVRGNAGETDRETGGETGHDSDSGPELGTDAVEERG